MKDKVQNDWIRVATWAAICALIACVGWYYRATREGLEQQAVAQAHSQYLMGLNLLLADAQAYSKTNASIIPLINSVLTNNQGGAAQPPTSR